MLSSGFVRIRALSRCLLEVRLCLELKLENVFDGEGKQLREDHGLKHP